MKAVDPKTKASAMYLLFKLLKKYYFTFSEKVKKVPGHQPRNIHLFKLGPALGQIMDFLQR